MAAEGGGGGVDEFTPIEGDPSEMDRKTLVAYTFQLREANAVLERRLQEGACRSETVRGA
jgi:hypothetical protein